MPQNTTILLAADKASGDVQQGKPARRRQRGERTGSPAGESGSSTIDSGPNQHGTHLVAQTNATSGLLSGANLRRLFSFTLLLAFAYFTYLMALITWQYVPLDFDVAFLRLKSAEIRLPYYQWAFFGHVYTSIFVLLLGGVQFISTVRRQWPRLHRNLGKLYVGLILLVAAPGGLIMGIHANGGWSAQLSFCLQAVLWLIFTWHAYSRARAGDWPAHRAFMLRSFALTLSAVTLRLWKWGIVAFLAPPPMDTYRAVAWLGWVGNLLVVEIWLWKVATKV